MIFILRGIIKLADKTKAMLSYIPFLGWILAIIFLITDKKDKFVRFHAMQSIFLFFAITILSMVPFFGWVARLGGFVLLIYMMVQSYDGKKKKLPIIGDMASKCI